MADNIGFDVMNLFAMVFELILMDEENQIKGVVHVADAKGLGMAHFTVFSPQYSVRIGKNSEVNSNYVTVRRCFKLLCF